MIDLSCHLLPGLGDGPTTLEQSVQLARRAVEAGVTTVAVTPPVGGATADWDPASLSERVAELRDALRRSGVALDVVAGAEVAFAHVTELGDETLRLLTLGGGRSLLVACPGTRVSQELELGLFELQRRGFVPVLRHPERSPSLAGNPDRLARLVNLGVRSVVSARSLGGEHGEEARRAGVDLLDRGLVHAVVSEASDAERPYPDPAAVLRRVAGEAPDAAARARSLTYDAPAAILAGDESPRAAGAPMAAPVEEVAPAEVGPAHAGPADAGPATTAGPSARPAPARPTGSRASGSRRASRSGGSASRRSAPRRSSVRRRGAALAVLSGALALLLGVLAIRGSFTSPAVTPDRGLATSAARQSTAAVPILNFGGSRSVEGERRLDAQVRAVTDAGYRAVDADAVAALRRGAPPALPARPLLLSFDEGTTDVAAADRALSRHRMRGTLFVATGEVGRPGHLRWEQLAALARTGRWDFGSHSRSGSSMVVADALGNRGPFLVTRRWLPDVNRYETDGQYAARVDRDLGASLRDFTSRGLPAPRLFAFPPSAGAASADPGATGAPLGTNGSSLGAPEPAGQVVPPALRAALFGRFAVALLDVRPPTLARSAARYLPRIRVSERTAPERLVAEVAQAEIRAQRLADRPTDEAERRRTIEGWATALRTGDPGRAASFFAPGAVVEQSVELVLTSRAAATEWNRRLPCRSRVRSLREIGAVTLATFDLLPAQPTCPTGGTVQVRVLVRGGRFEEWRQVPEQAPAPTGDASA